LTVPYTALPSLVGLRISRWASVSLSRAAPSRRRISPPSRQSPPTIIRSITTSNIAASAATGGPLAHGFQILSFTAAGASTFAHQIGDSLIAFVEQSSKFLKPVYAGDTLYPMLEIAALTPQRSTGVVTLKATVHNQNGELVLIGEQKILLRKRPPRWGSLPQSREKN
jgi:hypothetical protein